MPQEKKGTLFTNTEQFKQKVHESVGPALVTEALIMYLKLPDKSEKTAYF